MVSDVGDGADDGGIPELAAESADGDGDDVGEGVGVLVVEISHEALLTAPLLRDWLAETRCRRGGIQPGRQDATELAVQRSKTGWWFPGGP